MAIIGYDLDMDEEPCVFGALALIQLRRLSLLLKRVKGVARTWKWESHVAIVDGTEEQVKCHIRKYDKAPEVDG